MITKINKNILKNKDENICNLIKIFNDFNHKK